METSWNSPAGLLVPALSPGVSCRGGGLYPVASQQDTCPRGWGTAGCREPSSVLRCHLALPQGWGKATSPLTASCLCRRGSPLLIGVRSKYKLSTEQIPILYRTRKCFEKGLNRATGLQCRQPPSETACFPSTGASLPPGLQAGEGFLPRRLSAAVFCKSSLSWIFSKTRTSPGNGMRLQPVEAFALWGAC